MLFDPNGGFSAIMKMFDYDPRTELKERDYAGTGQWTLHAPMLALSNPDPSLAFPVGTLLQPQLFIRNVTAKPVDAALAFNWRTDTNTGKASGPLLRLSPYETRRVDVAALQDGKTLPQIAQWASVILTTNSLPNEVVAVAASYDQTLKYGAQTPFSDQLAFHWAGSEWQYDPLHDSIITVGNGGTKPTQAAFTILYNQGTQKYELDQTLQPGEQMWMDIGKLIRESIPDKSGKTLPPTLTTGSYEIRDLNNHAIGTLFEGKVIYDKTYGHVTYGCGLCCGYKKVQLWLDPLGVDFQGTSDNGVNGLNACGGDWEDTSDAFFGNWSSANTGIATVDYYGTHTGQGVGSTTSSTHGSFTGWRPGTVNCPVQGGSPGGGDNVNPTVTFAGGNNFIFDGSDPTVTGFNLEQVQGTPSQGTFTWSATTTSTYHPNISFNGSPGPYSTASDVVTVTADTSSTSLLDTTLTVGYSVSNVSAQVPATRAITIRLFRFLQQVGSIQNIFLNGPQQYGITSNVTYSVYTNPSDQVLQSGFGGISVYESVSLTASNFPINLNTASTSLNSNSQIVDDLSVTASSSLPPSFSATVDQYLGVGGFIVRHNTITYSSSGPSINNLGPYN